MSGAGTTACQNDRVTFQAADRSTPATSPAAVAAVADGSRSAAVQGCSSPSSLLFGVNPPGELLGGETGQQGTTSAAAEIQQQLDACTYEMANENTICRIKATTVSVDDVWSDLMAGYQPPKTVIFADSVNTGCGAASAATGPFYCPRRPHRLLRSVLLHAAAPHGRQRRSARPGIRRRPRVRASRAEPHRCPRQGPADGFAGSALGFGARGTAGRLPRRRLGQSCRRRSRCAARPPISEQQITTVIQTAKTIGDDTIQGPGSNPEGWTHGSATQRARWFGIGYQSGDPQPV